MNRSVDKVIIDDDQGGLRDRCRLLVEQQVVGNDPYVGLAVALGLIGAAVKIRAAPDLPAGVFAFADKFLHIAAVGLHIVHGVRVAAHCGVITVRIVSTTTAPDIY